MDQFIAQLRGFVTKNAFALVVGLITLATVFGSLRIATPARKQKAVLAAESAQLEAVIASSNLWVTQFQPASNEEAAIWQTTEAEIQSLGVKPSERLTLAQVVARRFDEAGYQAPHTPKFLPADATVVPARSVAGVSFNPAPYRLQLTGVGSFGSLFSLLETLPPAVELQSVSLAGATSGVNTTLTLSVFEPAGTNGK